MWQLYDKASGPPTEAIVDPMLPSSGRCDSLTLFQAETASTRCTLTAGAHYKIICRHMYLIDIIEAQHIVSYYCLIT